MAYMLEILLFTAAHDPFTLLFSLGFFKQAKDDYTLITNLMH